MWIPDAQKWIATLEATAQWILLHLRLREGAAGDIELRAEGVQLRQHCDNSSVVGASRKLFSTSAPLCFALQGLAWECARRNVTTHVTHRSGDRNVFADALSRLSENKHCEFRSALDPCKQRSVNVKEFLNRPWRMWSS